MTADTIAARAAALALLSGALRDRHAVDSRFAKETKSLEARDRAFVRLLVATALRRLGQIDAVLSKFVQRTPPAAVEDTLRLGAAQALFLDTAPHAAVDTSVELVKRIRHPRMAGLVNAVLRKVASQGKAELDEQDAARLNTPGWLWEGWAKAYGQHVTRAIATVHLQEAPLDLSLKDQATADTWCNALPAERLPTGTVRVSASGPVQDMPGFAEGAWWVQDAAASLPAKVLLQALEDPEGKSVADLCAAPGGKTLQLSAAGCAVTAVDESEARLALLRDNVARIGVDADVVQTDILQWQPDTLFDAVLLDAPCSATGTLRRHPDLGYIKSRKAIRSFPKQQRALLERAVNLLKPGGVLVYAVCALEPEEGEEVVSAVSEPAGLLRIPIDPAPLGLDPAWVTDTGAVRTLPCHWAEKGGLDGFFIALLKSGESAQKP